MILSVALCTYNGAKYIEEQLRSILNQTMQVDEIVICDDGSIDETVEIVKRIKKDADVEIRIFQNEINLGFKENFFNGIEKCNGDVVFLSDQDDLWCPNKVDAIVRWLDAHSDKMVVFSDAFLIDETGNYLEGSLWKRFGFDRKKQKYFDKGFGLDIWAWSNRATGATMAVRKSYIESIGWRKSNDDFHDKIIALHGLEDQLLGYINQKLICYRLHGGQACGANNLSKELFSTPLKPCIPAFLDFDICSISDKGRKHVEFLFQRASCKFSWFGMAPITMIAKYFRDYHLWAYKYVIYDIYVSVRHSIKRVLYKD